jgi:hypothetical protein
VELGFAETNTRVCAVGGRIFSVVVQGGQVLRDLDVFRETGACNTALVRTFGAVVTAGSPLTVQFVRGAANDPYVASIVVTSVGGGGGTSTTASSTTATSTCQAVPGNNGGETHRAHAVPGAVSRNRHRPPRPPFGDCLLCFVLTWSVVAPHSLFPRSRNLSIRRR